MNGPELRDIHLPDASLWWPPAPAWLLLLILLVAAMIGLWLRHRYRYPSLRRLSLNELGRIRARLREGQGESEVLRELCRLLRRTLMAYHGRRGVAASTGDAWTEQLQSLASGGFDAAQLQLLSQGRYRRDCNFDAEALLQACETWIRELPRRPIDVAV